MRRTVPRSAMRRGAAESMQEAGCGLRAAVVHTTCNRLRRAMPPRAAPSSPSAQTCSRCTCARPDQTAGSCTERAGRRPRPASNASTPGHIDTEAGNQLRRAQWALADLARA
eukprot:275167-Chlamydomonas_euryale.AAC.1